MHLAFPDNFQPRNCWIFTLKTNRPTGGTCKAGECWHSWQQSATTSSYLILLSMMRRYNLIEYFRESNMFHVFLYVIFTLPLFIYHSLGDFRILVCKYTWSILVFGTHKCSESLDFAATICETLGHWSSCTAQDEFTKKI